jgi:hypothetical protein
MIQKRPRSNRSLNRFHTTWVQPGFLLIVMTQVRGCTLPLPILILLLVGALTTALLLLARLLAAALLLPGLLIRILGLLTGLVLVRHARSPFRWLRGTTTNRRCRFTRKAGLNLIFRRQFCGEPEAEPARSRCNLRVQPGRARLPHPVPTVKNRYMAQYALTRRGSVSRHKRNL